MDDPKKTPSSEYTKYDLDQLPGTELGPAASKCVACDELVADSKLFRRLRVCPFCRFHSSITARRYIATLVDQGSFEEIGTWVKPPKAEGSSKIDSYLNKIEAERIRTGLPEAVLTGTCQIGGIASVIIAVNFGFHGGSMGMVVGERVSLAFEHASQQRIPCVAVITSGGERADEGVLSAYQMIKTLTAQKRLSESGKPFISVLGNPASGPVMASFATQADLLFAEPGAMIGLADMQSIVAQQQDSTVDDQHDSEAMLKHGQIDRVVDRERLRHDVALALDMLCVGTQFNQTPEPPPPPPPPDEGLSGSDLLRVASDSVRPTAGDYIAKLTTDWMEFSGDRINADDQAVRCGVAKLDGVPVVFIAQQRNSNGSQQIKAQGFRKARRAALVASKFGLPIVTFVDGLDHAVGVWDEHQGIAISISNLMSALATVPTTSVAVVIGVASGIGGVAFSVADRVLMLSGTVVSIGGKDTEGSLITPFECVRLKVADAIIPEPTSSETMRDETAALLRKALVHYIGEGMRTNPSKVALRREQRYRDIGEYGSRVGNAIRKELAALQTFVSTWGRSVRRR